jgi:hypothetical protein
MSQGAPRNYVGEWFGHRIFPVVKASAHDVGDFTSARCPFLSEVTRKPCRCIKNQNSLGVCTITTTYDRVRDWMACPYRALDLDFLMNVVHQIFGSKADSVLYPISALAENLHQAREESEKGKSVYVFFQEKLGGEINLSSTDRSPELSFDITIVPIHFRDEALFFNSFGILEVQTMDFHGSYRHAITALRNAVDLHDERFPQILAANPEWMGRKIEGPNIANVFKRTFYQLLIKFRLAGKGGCEGVVLGLPTAVWESWGPHLNAPPLAPYQNGWVLEGTTPEELEKSWIYIFRTDTASAQSREPLIIDKVVRVGVESLLEKAFSDVPAFITDHLIDKIRDTIRARMRIVCPSVKIDG